MARWLYANVLYATIKQFCHYLKASKKDFKCLGSGEE